MLISFQATKAIIDREAPGLGIAMITKSLHVTPMAMLTRCVRTVHNLPTYPWYYILQWLNCLQYVVHRLVCGIRKNTLIVNLPGSKKGSQVCDRYMYIAADHNDFPPSFLSLCVSPSSLSLSASLSPSSLSPSLSLWS